MINCLTPPILKEQWLTCFLAVRQHRNILSVAQSLGLTVRSVERNLKELEAALGTALFYYPDKENIQFLTDGLALFKQLEPILQELDALEAYFQTAPPPSLPNLCLGWDQIWLPLLLPRLLDKLAKDFAGAIPDVTRLSSIEQFAVALLNKEIDIALVSEPIQHPQLRVAAGHPSPYLIVGTPQPSLSWEQLRYVTFETEIQGCLSMAWDDLLYPRKIIMKADNLGPILDMCLSGLAVAWLPACTVSHLLKSGQLASVATPPQPAVLTPHLVWHEDQEQEFMLSEVLQILKKFISKKDIH